MNRVLSRVTAIGVAVLVTLGVGALSQIPYAAESADHAVIRLAWRIRGIRVEDCRTLTQEELDRIPQHMRMTEECEGRILPFRLRLYLDDRKVVDEVIRAAGTRGDRPLYVYHEENVSPGTVRIRVEFDLQGQLGEGDAVESPDADWERESVTPTSLDLVAAIRLSAGEVALVTYDAEAKRLVLRGYGPS